MRTADPGLVLAACLIVAAAAATAPAGLDGRSIPLVSWILWSAVPAAAIVLLRWRRGVGAAARLLAPLLPVVALLTLPVVLFASTSSGAAVGLALFARALATASAGVVAVAYLRPVGVIAGLRSLRLPGRLVDVAEATLVSLTAIGAQVAGMLRASAARGTGSSPWRSLSIAPRATTKAFGRVIAALLLRSLERAEALERARRARGAGPW